LHAIRRQGDISVLIATFGDFQATRHVAIACSLTKKESMNKETALAPYLMSKTLTRLVA